MKRLIARLALVFTTSCLLHLNGGHAEAAPKQRTKNLLINLNNREQVQRRRPLLVAHRGGVVSPQAPECSATAIEAAMDIFDMIELDVRTSKDGVPVVFHDRSLLKACGVDKRIADLPVSEIATMKYLNTDTTILTLDSALALCRLLSMGVMFDIKEADEAELQEIVRLTRKHGLENSAVTINGDATIQKHLRAVSRIRLLSEEQADKMIRDSKESLPLKGYFWFGLPKDVPLERVADFQRHGALIIPGVNVFRYPREEHLKSAEKDIHRLREAGVDGFQIDSVYLPFFSE